MPINAHPEYFVAEKEYQLAESVEDKLEALEKMVSTAPKHKGGENLRAQLSSRYKKLKSQIEKSKKSGKGKQKGIRKHEMQTVLVGFPNTGKSSLFNLLTNQKALVTPHPFTTFQPEVGMINFEDAQIQLIDSPAFPNHDKSTTNITDTHLIVIDNIEQIKQSENYLKKSPSTKIFLFNKIDLLNENEKRKLQATLKSKFPKHQILLFSTLAKDSDSISKLKQTLFNTFPIIRIYTKEPNQKEASKKPMLLKKESTISDAAEKILKGFSKKVLKAKVWGPSSKFPGQNVGVSHILKDKDVLELDIK